MDKIEKIRQEIKRLRKEIKDDKDPLAPNQKAGYLFALADMESFLNTISEEPDKSLEEAAEEYALLFEDSTKWKDGGKYKGFIAGAEWQAEKDARDMYMSDNRHYEKVYQLGKKAMKEQMMKDAVEGEVCLYQSYNRDATAIIVDIPKENLGDKVRIIIVKEENK